MVRKTAQYFQLLVHQLPVPSTAFEQHPLFSAVRHPQWVQCTSRSFALNS